MGQPQVSTQIAPHRLNAIHLFCNGWTMHVDKPFNCIHILDDGKRCAQPIGKQRRDKAIRRNFDISCIPLERLEEYMGQENKENKIINRVLSCVFCVWHHGPENANCFIPRRERCRVWLRQEVVRMRIAANAAGASTSAGSEYTSEEERVDFENGLPHEGNSTAQNIFQTTAEDAWRNYNRKWHGIENWISGSNNLPGNTKWQKLPEYLQGFKEHNIMYAIPWPTRNSHPNTFSVEEVRRFYEQSIFFTKYSTVEDGHQEHMSLEDVEHAREVLHREESRWMPLASYVVETSHFSLLYLTDHYDYAAAKAIQDVLKILESLRQRITQPILQMEIVEGQSISLPVYDFSDMLGAIDEMKL